MLKEAIFQEHLEKKEVIQENEEMEEDEPEVEVIKQRPLNRRARADPIEAVPEPPTKKMRTDPEDQVT